MTSRDALSVLLDECPTCKGHVVLGTHYLSDPYTGEALPPQDELCSNPDCVDGLIIPEAVVEAAAKAIDERYGKQLRGPWDIWRVDPRSLVRAVLEKVRELENQ